MNKSIYSGHQNIQKYKISNEYGVMFFTVGRCAFFRYFEDDGIEVSLIDRSCVLPMLSGEEIEKLSKFIEKTKEEYNKYIF